MKKSHSAVSALSSTIRLSSQNPGASLKLSDSEDEEYSAPPPKKFKSDIGPSLVVAEKEHRTLAPKSPSLCATTSPTEPKLVSANFAEVSASCDSLLPPELDLDIENALLDFLEPQKPDIEDYCSSSSEFELDSDDDFCTASLVNASSISESITETFTSTCDSSSTTQASTSQNGAEVIPPVIPRFSASSTQKRAQSAITNYFGVRKVDGTVTKTSSVVVAPVPKSRIISPPITAPSSKTAHFGDFEGVQGESSTSTYSPKVKDACPFYKRIAGTTFLVDDFRFVYKSPQTNSFFLTHFHSDHYQGLTSRFDRGLIYCSPVTANLVISTLRVRPQYVRAVHWRIPTMVEGVEVTFFDANHCPGAALILFRLPDRTLYLHTGDFRFDSTVPDHLTLLGMTGKIANLYLDTTYANPSYTFPHQQLVISSVLDLLTPYARDAKTLFIVGTYTIGKEKMFLSIAERFALKFYCKASKLKILKCLEIDPILDEFATTEEATARIHIVPIFDISIKKLEAFLDDNKHRWTRVIAIRPTGWTYEKSGWRGMQNKTSTASSSSTGSSAQTTHETPSKVQKKSTSPASGQNKAGVSTTSSRRGAITIHSAPYSEHSSFSELCTFVRTLRPRWIIPTVNNRSREAVVEMVKNLRG